MTTALRRRFDSLRRLAARPGTAGEGEAAQAAIARIGARLAALGMEELGERAEQIRPAKLRRRDRRPRPRGRIHVGDIVDAVGTEGTFRYCACGGSRFQVEEGTPPVAVAWLRCTGCSRARKLRREDFHQQCS